MAEWRDLHSQELHHSNVLTPCRFIAAARDLLLSSDAQEAVTVGVPRRLKASDAAPRASRSLFGSSQQPAGSSASSRSGSRSGTPTGAAAAAASSSSLNGLEDEDPLLASGEYAIRCAIADYMYGVFRPASCARRDPLMAARCNQRWQAQSTPLRVRLLMISLVLGRKAAVCVPRMVSGEHAIRCA